MTKILIIMKKEILNIELISESEMIGGALISGKGVIYDLSFLIGYGFAWLTDHMGSHANKYGLAFK